MCASSVLPALERERERGGKANVDFVDRQPTNQRAPSIHVSMEIRVRTEAWSRKIPVDNTQSCLTKDTQKARERQRETEEINEERRTTPLLRGHSLLQQLTEWQ